MKPGISEFSYGYALTEELLNLHFRGVTRIGAPILPSLNAEATRGYDLRIRFVRSLLFLQFKLSDCMVRDSAIECTRNGLLPPFHRFYVHGRKQSSQHQLLMGLEQSKAGIPKLVFYVAPAFHKAAELDRFYTQRQVARRSVFIRPNLIGPFHDQDEHKVAFAPHSTGFCVNSEPRTVEKSVGLEPFLVGVAAMVAESRPLPAEGAEIAATADALRRLVAAENIAVGVDVGSEMSRREPLAVIALLARNHFGCETIVLGEFREATTRSRGADAES